MSKSVLESKTLWVNLVLAIVAFFPNVANLLTQEVLLQVVAIVNIVLRLFTKEEVKLLK